MFTCINVFTLYSEMINDLTWAPEAVGGGGGGGGGGGWDSLTN